MATQVHLTDTQPPAFWVGVVSLSALLHYAVFRGWPRGSSLERSYVASTVHAVVCLVALAAWAVLFDADMFNTKRMLVGQMGTGDEYMPVLLSFSAGYFISDLLIMATAPGVADVGSVVHHFLILPCLILGLLYNVAIPYMFFYLIEELSTPFLNMKSLYRSNATIYKTSSALFAIAFLLSRLGIGSYITYTLVINVSAAGLSYFPTNAANFVFVYEYSCLGLTRLLNLYWSSAIVRKLLSSGKPKARSKTA